MDFFQSIDIYCERKSLIFWSEPINALTNFFFIIIGFHLFIKTFQDKLCKLLSLELVLIGICSFFFHTFANITSAILDTFSIILFGLTYLFAANIRFLNFSYVLSTFSIITFIPYSFVVTFSIQFFIEPTNGSAFYFSYILLFLIYSIVLIKKNSYVSKNLFLCFLILLISIILRSFDQKFCSNISIGTHFLWHILNSIVLGISIITINTKQKTNKKLSFFAIFKNK